MAEKLSGDSFTEEKGRGFILNKVRSDQLNGKFVEKVIYEDKILSLYGEENIIERIEYKVTEFLFNEDSYPIAVIVNPPRTLKPFANALVRNLGFGTSMEEIVIEPFRWVKEIMQEQLITIHQIDASQIQVSEYALAKMQITSSKDLLNYYHNELLPQKTRIDRLSASISTPEYSGKFRLFRNAMAYIEVKHEREFSNLLYNALKKAIQ
ncbi:hypothetical protein [Kluyvera intermedia]|nr:hypothetical protein [Kluyvera intermedia]